MQIIPMAKFYKVLLKEKKMYEGYLEFLAKEPCSGIIAMVLTASFYFLKPLYITPFLSICSPD